MKKLEGIRDVFKTAKYRKPSQIFCPRCSSPKIHLSSSLDVWLTPKQYYCPECGYLGMLVMELEPENQSLERENQEQKEEEE